MMWLLVALAGTPEPGLLHQEGVVASAAAAVAQARRDGVRAPRVAELMATYRQEAERLAAMQPPEDLVGEAQARQRALTALSDATVRGGEDPAARAVIDAWLGPLATRVDVLDSALATAAASPEDLARSLAVDVEAQAVATMLVGAYDASRAEVAVRTARARAAMLRAGVSPLEQAGLGVDVQLRVLDADAAAAAARTSDLLLLVTRAAGVRDRARTLWEQ